MGTRNVKSLAAGALWLAVAGVGTLAYAALAGTRGEPLNSGYLLVAALCTYAISYRFYSKWIAARALALNDRRATPCEVHDDGKDFVRTNKWIVFGHHFAAISGPGPLVGPVLAAQFGYLPGTLWILIGVVLGGAVQDMVILFASVRRNGRSLAQMVKDELNSTAGAIGIVAILAILTILLAVLALVVVNALAESPWGVFTVGATIPIAMLMGGYLRFVRVGKVLEVSLLGGALLLLAVWGGQKVYASPVYSNLLSLDAKTLAGAIILYGFAASVLPVWLLLAPRDYLSTFMKLGTIFCLAFGVLVVLPDFQMPALSKFVDGSGLVVPGKIFPFCFITIACGAISGFHALIASGTTPKIITRESYVRTIGYGAMCLESLVAIMAMIAACALEPGVYLAMNVKGAGDTPAAIQQDIRAKVHAAQFTLPPSLAGEKRAAIAEVDPAAMQKLADEVGEKSLYGRTGGAATLAVGMASILSKITHGRWLDLWYHFAIMFEALFILTTLDAGTRVGRYLLQDFLGKLHAPLGDTRKLSSNLLASLLMVSGWSFFLVLGVRDPDGGVKALWPIFGIANQMLAAIALCLAVTILLKMHLPQAGSDAAQPLAPPRRSPWFALVPLVPLVWLLAVTFTAGGIKIFHPDKRMGFLAAAKATDAALPGLQQKLAEARTGGDAPAIGKLEKTIRENRVVHFNHVVDAAATAVFLLLVAVIVLLSIREWVFLLVRHKLPQLHEAPPHWRPGGTPAESRPTGWLGVLAFALLAAREWSGEAAAMRGLHAAQHRPCPAPNCPARVVKVSLLGKPPAPSRGEIFAEMLEKRHEGGINRCC